MADVQDLYIGQMYIIYFYDNRKAYNNTHEMHVTQFHQVLKLQITFYALVYKNIL